MKQWTIETLVAQLRRTVLEVTSLDILDPVEVDGYTVTEMMDALRQEAFLRGMPSIGESSRPIEIPGQTKIEVEDALRDETTSETTTKTKGKEGSL